MFCNKKNQEFYWYDARNEQTTAKLQKEKVERERERGDLPK